MSFQTGAEPVPGYKIMDRLGSGGFGEVWKCEAPGGIFKAMKVIHGDLRQKDSDAYRFAEQELKALKRVKMVRHPYLLALDRYDIVDGRLVITMELADCNLWERFRDCRAAGHEGIPREELLQYMSESAEVLDLMYDKHQLQHLDIKPQNLFLVHNHVKVADFGQVKDLEGLVASVTGGITPVYAAPETFDGYVSRYCDQYSLACVYQELLTGQRPFDGTSMQQLLMQHLQGVPNLNPSPVADRPMLARALSKKPEDRYPSVAAFINAIRAGTPAAVRSPAMAFAGSSSDSGSSISFGDTGTGTGSGDPIFRSSFDSNPPPTGTPGVDQSTGLHFLNSAPSFDPTVTSFGGIGNEKTAPPEKTGPGTIRPAIVIGLGHTGQQILRRFRKRLTRDYGQPDALPAFRSILIDTDEEALLESQKSFPSADMVPAALNRPAHYLRPRANGRTVMEGWFDPKILHTLPRAPLTMGLRALGRLAFCDHYRAIMQKFQTELDACAESDALNATCDATGQQLRTNRPRIYIAAGLGGGTGGGMFLDLAYAVRARMRRLGYEKPEIIGLLMVPPDGGPGQVSPQALANTYAALTELYHYGDANTVYTAAFDERFGNIRDTEPPFSRVVLLPGLEHPASSSHTPSAGTTPRASGTVGPLTSRRTATVSGTAAVRDKRRSGVSRSPDATSPGADFEGLAEAARLIGYELLTPLGRVADENRPAAAGNTATTFGMARFGWPRAKIVERAARVIAPVLLGHWVSPDAQHVRDTVPKWAQERFHQLGLNYETFSANLRHADDGLEARALEDRIRHIVEPLTPKGWLARLPESSLIAGALEQLTRLIGPPRESEKRPPSVLEAAVGAAAVAAGKTVSRELCDMFPALLDAPDFRFAGTEAAIRQLLAGVNETASRFAADIAEHEPLATHAYDRLAFFSYPQKGTKRGAASELADVLRDYPAHWLKCLFAKHALVAYSALQEMLASRLADVSACRQKAQAAWKAMAAEAERVVEPGAGAGADLLPPGCVTAEDAAQKFIKALNDEDLNEVERRVQQHYNGAFGGVYEACVNTADGPESLGNNILAVTRAYLDERLGEVDFHAMLMQRYGTNAAVSQAIARAYYEAEPKLVSGGLWEQSQLTVLAQPQAAMEKAVNESTMPLLPERTVVASIPDEIVLYREFPAVPLSALPQFGPSWATAYRTAPEILQIDPHVRIDVTQWLDIDVDRL